MDRQKPTPKIEGGKQHPKDSCMLYIGDYMHYYMDQNITPAFIKLTGLVEDMSDKMTKVHDGVLKNSKDLENHMKNEDRDRKWILGLLVAMCTVAMGCFGWLLNRVESIHNKHDDIQIHNTETDVKIDLLSNDLKEIQDLIFEPNLDINK